MARVQFPVTENVFGKVNFVELSSEAEEKESKVFLQNALYGPATYSNSILVTAKGFSNLGAEFTIYKNHLELYLTSKQSTIWPNSN